MDDKNRCFGAILVRGWHINKDLSFFSYRFLLRLEGGIVAAENFTVREPHGELERFSLWISALGQVGIDLVSRADRDLAIAFSAGILRVRIGRRCTMDEQAYEANGARKPTPDGQIRCFCDGRFSASGTQPHERKL